MPSNITDHYITFHNTEMVFTDCKQSLRRLCFLHVSVILSGGGGKGAGGGGIPACTTGHMTKHYISSCTGDQSQLVTGEHTGNIKCMMGYVTWYTPRQANPWAGTPPPWPGTPPWAGTPPWSMSGRYASYWNAFLLIIWMSNLNSGMAISSLQVVAPHVPPRNTSRWRN